MVFNVIFKNNLVSEHMMSCMVMSELNLFCLEVNGHKIVVSQDITITIYPTGTHMAKKKFRKAKICTEKGIREWGGHEQNYKRQQQTRWLSVS